MSDFVAALKAAGEAMGVRAHACRVDPQSGGWRAVVSMPPMWVELGEDDHGSPERIVDMLDDGKRALFSRIVDHIATHDRSPIDRLKQIEDAARKSLPRDPYADTGDQRDLRHLLDAKPGAVSWQRNGYGEDPK